MRGESTLNIEYSPDGKKKKKKKKKKKCLQVKHFRGYLWHIYLHYDQSSHCVDREIERMPEVYSGKATALIIQE